ncbi:hypothetical protein BDR26DRAFT_898423 [Obelidium mucronatum]|nr:hypothetical protein BDR26DRAFT_898423 [Obelidium mucronatum]
MNQISLAISNNDNATQLRAPRSHSNRRPSTSNKKDESITITKLLDLPTALSGQLELYIKPTKHDEEGVLVDRFFVLASRTVYMFVSRMTTGKPLAAIDLSPAAYIVTNIQGATDLAFEVVGETGGLLTSWILCSKTIATKNLWVDVITHAIKSSIDEAAKFAASAVPSSVMMMLPPRNNSYPMNRSVSHQGDERRTVNPNYQLQHEEYRRVLSQRLQVANAAESAKSQHNQGRAVLLFVIAITKVFV